MVRDGAKFGAVNLSDFGHAQLPDSRLRNLPEAGNQRGSAAEIVAETDAHALEAGAAEKWQWLRGTY